MARFRRPEWISTIAFQAVWTTLQKHFIFRDQTRFLLINMAFTINIPGEFRAPEGRARGELHEGDLVLLLTKYSSHRAVPLPNLCIVGMYEPANSMMRIQKGTSIRLFPRDSQNFELVHGKYPVKVKSTQFSFHSGRIRDIYVHPEQMAKYLERIPLLAFHAEWVSKMSPPYVLPDYLTRNQALKKMQGLEAKD